MNKKKVVKPKKKPPVKKAQVVKQQTQTQRQVVNINIGKHTKSKSKQRQSTRPAKATILPSGHTIIMNPHVPQAPSVPQAPQQPMERTQPVNTIFPSTPAYVPEYVGVNYLDDSERVIDPMRTARLKKFINEPMSRVINLSDISDLTSENSSADYISSEYTPFESVSSVIASSIPDSSIYYNEPIQLSEMDLINQSIKPSISGNINYDRLKTARMVRQAQQLSLETGGDVPIELLLEGNYGYSANGQRRRMPTKLQRERLFNAGKPYIGDENGVVSGRKQKKII
jgi:hypothetical protein